MSILRGWRFWLFDRRHEIVAVPQERRDCSKPTMNCKEAKRLVREAQDRLSRALGL